MFNSLLLKNIMNMRIYEIVEENRFCFENVFRAYGASILYACKRNCLCEKYPDSIISRHCQFV